mmetsp:Transcript_20987/g.49278  ORF Transcript_20987/g.49278 Transcript_20987/m.49278 type:complete len:239 (-) Transcript_20987:285-1001(-)
MAARDFLRDTVSPYFLFSFAFLFLLCLSPWSCVVIRCSFPLSRLDSIKLIAGCYCAVGNPLSRARSLCRRFIDRLGRRFLPWRFLHAIRSGHSSRLRHNLFAWRLRGFTTIIFDIGGWNMLLHPKETRLPYQKLNRVCHARVVFSLPGTDNSTRQSLIRVVVYQTLHPDRTVDCVCQLILVYQLPDLLLKVQGHLRSLLEVISPLDDLVKKGSRHHVYEDMFDGRLVSIEPHRRRRMT